MSINKKIVKGISFRIHAVLFVFFYALFALDRIKKALSFTINGIVVTNEIWLIVLIIFLLLTAKMINYENETKFKLNENIYCYYFAVSFLLYVLVIIIGGFNAVSMSQYLCAVLYIIIPVLLYFVVSKLTMHDITLLYKIMVVTCLIYAVFAIILSTNYAFFMKLVGNPVDDYKYYSQYRASMMLGSSITVSYYMNLSLPLCFYMFMTGNNGKWCIVSAAAVIANIAATSILLSRNAFFCIILTLILLFMFVKDDTKNQVKKITMFIILFIAGAFVVGQYDLSRLWMGIDLSSDSARLSAAKLGLYIFSLYPFCGSGVGRYFSRVFDSRIVTIDGFTGLIDPHNMYILVLSETGIAGFLLLLITFLMLLKGYSFITKDSLRITSYITLFVFLFNSIGGSHLFNEISFSVVFWIYMGSFNAASINDRMKNIKMEKRL